MTSSNYAISYQARFTAGAAGLLVGDAVYFDVANDGYDQASPASLAAGARAAGVVAKLGPGRGFILHSAGPVSPAITGLAPGSQSWVRVSAAGRLERVLTPGEGDDIVGQCDASGLLHASFGMRYASGGGSSLPGGTGILVGHLGALQTYAVQGGVGTPYLNGEETTATDTLTIVPNGAVNTLYAMGPDGPLWKAPGNYVPTFGAPEVGKVLAVGSGPTLTWVTPPASPWTPGAYEIPTWDLTNAPANLVPYDVDIWNPYGSALALRVAGIRGDVTDSNLTAAHLSYNRNYLTAALTAARMGPFGYRGVQQWTAAGAAFTRTFSFPTAADWDAFVDLRANWKVGTTASRVQTSWWLKRRGATVTATLLSTAPTEGDATIATVAAALSAPGNVVTLTLTPNAAITTCAWRMDGDVVGL